MKHWLLGISLVCFGSYAKASSISGETSHNTLSGNAVVPSSTVDAKMKITVNPASSLGSASVYAAIMANILMTDLIDHVSDTTHFIGGLFIATTTVNSKITAIGVEGRVNLLDVAPTSTQTVVHIGVLGYANGYGNSNPDNNLVVGVSARARKTVLSDGGGAALSTGTVIGFYSGTTDIVGGYGSYGFYLASGASNYLSGKLGVGVVAPSYMLDISGYDTNNFGTARFLSGNNPLFVYLGRTTNDLILGVANGAGQIVNSAVAGSVVYRSGGGAQIWTNDSSGVRTDMTISAAGGVSLASMTLTGMFHPTPKTRAQFSAMTGVVGDMYICSDCTIPYSMCVGTGAVISGWKVTHSATVGCGTNN